MQHKAYLLLWVAVKMKDWKTMLYAILKEDALELESLSYHIYKIFV